jgi:chromosomal replication initiation ATPase DnaA
MTNSFSYIIPGLRIKQNPDVLNLFLAYYKTDLELLRSKSRKTEIVILRALFVYLMRKYNKTSYSKLGKFLNRDHATIINSYNTAINLLDTNKTIKNQIVKLEKIIENEAIQEKNFKGEGILQ